MGHNPMVDTTASYRQSITARLASARQSLALLQSQLRAGVADPAYWVDRIDDLIELFELLGEERAANDQQRRLAAVYEVSRVLGTSLDLDEVLNQVMDAIIHLTGAERGFLMLFDTGAEPEIRVARNMEREALDDEASGISRSVINLVVETGEQVVTTNATRDPRFYDQPSVVAHHLRSILCVPLQARGSLIGVIYVDNRIRSGVFDEADLEMLTTFATQAAMAIENARLFTMTDEALSRRVEELQQLQEIDRQLNETLDFDRVMQLTLDWAVRVTGADNGAIGLFDVEERRTRVIAQHGPSPQAAIAMLSGADEPASGLIVPVRREGRTIGVIALDRESGQPSDREAAVGVDGVGVEVGRQPGQPTRGRQRAARRTQWHRRVRRLQSPQPRHLAGVGLAHRDRRSCSVGRHPVQPEENLPGAGIPMCWQVTGRRPLGADDDLAPCATRPADVPAGRLRPEVDD